MTTAESRRYFSGLFFTMANAAVALAFLAAWIAPDAFGLRVRDFALLALVTILDTFVAAFLLFGIRSKGWRWFPRISRGLETIGFTIFFGVFYLAFGLSFGSWAPILGFVRTLAVAALTPRGDAVARALLHVRVLYMVLAMLLGAMIAVIVPWPALGAGGRLDVDPNTTGLFVDAPHTALVFGVLYYGGFALLEWWLSRIPDEVILAFSAKSGASPDKEP